MVPFWWAKVFQRLPSVFVSGTSHSQLICTGVQKQVPETFAVYGGFKSPYIKSVCSPVRLISHFGHNWIGFASSTDLGKQHVFVFCSLHN